MHFKKKIVAWVTPVLALIAFVLSILNTPVLTNFYLAPEVVISGGGSDPKSDFLIGIFSLSNEGFNPAKNVEIGFTIPKNHKFGLIPNIESEIIEQKNLKYVKKVRVKIPNLAANEKIIMLSTSESNEKSLRPEAVEFYVDLGVKQIPLCINKYEEASSTPKECYR